jgi:hypothetical protein
MSLRDLAHRTVEANRNGTTRELLDTAYAPGAVSVEAVAMGEGGREAVGLDAIRGKHAWWDSAMEMHDLKVEGPFFHGDDRFAVIFEADVTEKASGRRMKTREVAVYHVQGDRIVREEFFYAM